MLARLAKLASISIALRRAPLEKTAVLGALGSLAGGTALLAAKTVKKFPGASAAVAFGAPGAIGAAKQNAQKFREAQGQSQVPTPPGVG